MNNANKAIGLYNAKYQDNDHKKQDNEKAKQKAQNEVLNLWSALKYMFVGNQDKDTVVSETSDNNKANQEDIVEAFNKVWDGVFLKKSTFAMKIVGMVWAISKMQGLAAMPVETILTKDQKKYKQNDLFSIEGERNLSRLAQEIPQQEIDYFVDRIDNQKASRERRNAKQGHYRHVHIPRDQIATVIKQTKDHITTLYNYPASKYGSIQGNDDIKSMAEKTSIELKQAAWTFKPSSKEDAKLMDKVMEEYIEANAEIIVYGGNPIIPSKESIQKKVEQIKQQSDDPEREKVMKKAYSAGIVAENDDAHTINNQERTYPSAHKEFAPCDKEVTLNVFDDNKIRSNCRPLFDSCHQEKVVTPCSQDPNEKKMHEQSVRSYIEGRNSYVDKSSMSDVPVQTPARNNWWGKMLVRCPDGKIIEKPAYRFPWTKIESCSPYLPEEKRLRQSLVSEAKEKFQNENKSRSFNRV